MRNLIPFYISEKFKLNQTKDKINAAVLFTDVSGFTKMTSELMKNGKEGAEIIADAINKIFSPAINAVYNNNGFIANFAGDAFTAVFPNDKNSSAENALYAAQEILNVFQNQKTFKTKFGEFQISVKIGASQGNLNWNISLNDYQNFYYFSGESIDKSANSEKYADKNQIVCHNSIKTLIEDKADFTRINDDFSLLNNIQTSDSNKNSFQNADYEIQKKFYPEELLKASYIGEFREVISCFISIAEITENLDENVSEIIKLVHDYGGYFNRLNFGDKGAFILVFFGAPSAKEKLFSRAADFAVEVQKIKNLKTKIGMTFGTAYTGFVGNENRSEYTAQGNKVNLAARFMMKSNINEIIVGEEIFKKIQERYQIEYIEQSEFKGFEEALPYYKLIDRKTSVDIDFYTEKIVGREKEISQLNDFLKPLDNNNFGGIVYIDGIAGIGKSRIVNEFKERLDPDKYSWFLMPCDGILKRSFNPIIYFLKQYFEQSEKNSYEENKINFQKRLDLIKNSLKNKNISEELERTKSLIGALLNLYWDNSLYDNLEAKGRYENTIDAVKNLMKAEFTLKPAVIELEDGHWIDDDSAKFLEHLTRNIEDYPFLILSACRYKDDGSKFVFELPETVKQQRIEIGYLDNNGTSEMIKNHLNKDVIPEQTINLIFERSEGNPFYIEQILLYLEENSLLDENGKIKKDKFEIPSSINAVIISRIDKLTSELKEIVKTASILGREFAADVLSNMLLNMKSENVQIEKYLSEGEAEAVWSHLTEIKYIFKHALIREAIYEMQLKKRLKELHQLAGETIEDLYKENIESYYFELAEHYERAENKEKSAEYLLKSAEFCKSNFLNKKASDFYIRLLKQLDDDHSKKAEIYTILGQLHQTKAEFALSDKYYKEGAFEAEKAGDLEKEILARIKKAKLYFTMSRFQDAFDEADKCRKEAEENGFTTEYIKSLNIMGSYYQHTGNFEKSLEKFTEAVDLSEKYENSETLIENLQSLGVMHLHSGNYKESEEIFDRLIKLVDKDKDKLNYVTILTFRGTVYGRQNRFQKSLEDYNIALKTAKEIGYKEVLYQIYSQLGILYGMYGNFDKSLQMSSTAYEFAKEIGSDNFIASALASQGMTFANNGEFERAVENLTKSAGIYERINDVVRRSQVLIGLGVGYFKTGDYKRSLDTFNESLKFYEETENIPLIARNKTYIAEIYMTEGKFEKAMELYDEVLELASKIGDKALETDAYGCIAQIYEAEGNHEKACEIYDKALKIDNEIQLLIFIPEHNYYKAISLYSMGKIDEAEELNLKALELAEKTQDVEVIFKSKILKNKILYHKTEDEEEKEKCYLEIEKITEGIPLQDLKGMGYYELWKLRGNAEYKDKSRVLYEKLYVKAPNFRYERILKEL